MPVRVHGYFRIKKKLAALKGGEFFDKKITG
jgi:hypothetical protein